MAHYNRLKGRNGDSGDWLRDLLHLVAVVLFKGTTGIVVFLSGPSLLSDQGIIIVGCDLWSKFWCFYIFLLIAIGAGCESEVSAPYGHIDAHGAVKHDVAFEFLCESLGLFASPVVVPEGDPPAVNLPPEEEAVVGAFG
jgi:hypothetical protein